MSDTVVVKQTTTETVQTAGVLMSDSPHYTRELPRSTTELMGQTAGDVAHGITRGGPVMMGVIVLNLVGIAAAIFFLYILIQGQQSHLANLLTLQTGQVEKIIAVHNREFDALMEMQKSVAEMQKIVAAAQSGPGPLQVAPQPALPPALQPRAR